uniref:Uncharacterized protein n=1 Tax=Panagrolaimus sp. ES5 TaxID=591445 RepID=A0AC34FWA8_9BILA
MYSAKCLENSQMDEKMQILLANKENQAERDEIELQNRRLQRELRQKETTIDELKARISALERRLEIDSSSLNSADSVPIDQEVVQHIPINQQQLQQQQHQRETTISKQQPVITSPPSTATTTIGSQYLRSDVRFRPQVGSGLSRLPASRRHDQRYHSNPIIPIMTPEPLTMDEMRKTLAVPVSERRKFFEHFM